MASPRVWFITGASTGFGRAMTELVLEKGEIAVATLRKPEVLSDLAAKYPKENLLVLKLDVRHNAEIVDAFDKVKESFGRLDIVFNNAGLGVLGEIESIPEDVARSMFDVNFWGAANVSRAAIKFLREVNKPGVGGTLLQVTSVVGLEGWPALGYYSASKHALEGFSEALAKELDPSWNIKVTSIAPGAFDTRGNKENLLAVPLHPAYTNPSLPSSVTRQYMNKTLNGDVEKAVKAIYKFVEQAERPIHFILGKDSIEAARRSIASLAADTDKLESYSADLEFDRLE